MANEKQDKTNWKNKLDEPVCMPDEVMIDKDAAWEKLHKRLRPKQRKIKVIWYWAAAACLFIAFAFSIFTSMKHERLLVKNITALHKKESIKIEHASSINNETSAIENTLGVKKKERNAFIAKRFNYVRTEKSISVIQTLAPVFENTIATKHQATINPVYAVDSISSIAAVISPVKKKIRVVHINELGNHSEGMALAAPNRQQDNLSIAIGSNNQTNKQTSVARDYAGIFKIKISSKN
jgi:hypothetical protein